MRLILRLAINAVALYVAVGTGWISGVAAQNTEWWSFALLGLVFGAVNLLVRPILKLLTCPLILLTLGLFTLVIGGAFGFGYTLAESGPGLLAAFLGGLVVGVVNAVLTMAFKPELGGRGSR